VGGQDHADKERQVGAKVTKGTRPFVSREPDRTSCRICAADSSGSHSGHSILLNLPRGAGSRERAAEITTVKPGTKG